ncbi:MAG: hypothetical protein K6A70_04035 [Erysipelotrichaceae bacterium]|jgi:hypothetical protein|nr:hypothetical protein [Erysipelotrichaceae bacterium]
MSKLLTVYDDKEPLNNVVSELTLDVDEVFYVYHHKISINNFINIDKVIKKYKDITTHYIQLQNDEEEIGKIINENPGIIIDVGGAKYLSLFLFDIARAKDFEMIYYDDEENVIKNYVNHVVVENNVFKLEIADVLQLRGGEIKDYMHHSITDQASKNTIVELFENNIDNYPAFIRYLTKINGLLNDRDYLGNNTYQLTDEKKHAITADIAYKKIGDFFKVEGDKLIFKNSRLRNLVTVSGAILENYLCIKLTESSYFDDVKMSVVIDFADDKYSHPVRCEVDCLVIKNNHLLFISCKSSKVDTPALNEIYVHNTRFGNCLSSAAICVVEELDRKYPSFYAKGQELNIYLIDKSSFKEGKVVDTFVSIYDGSYQYDELERA